LILLGSARAMLRSGNISNYRQISKYVTFNQRVVGSIPTALTIKQAADISHLKAGYFRCSGNRHSRSMAMVGTW
jgi:hypothetical protein